MQNTFASQDSPAVGAAKRYIQLGLTPIPLLPNQKTAFLRSWPTLRVRTLLRHFRDPDGNIGIRMGRQTDGRFLIAVDVDAKNGGRLSSLTQGRFVPETAEARTPSGGCHMLFAVPKNVTVRTRTDFVKGIDIIGARGLVVVEPSCINDVEYVWVRHPAHGIALAPGWLLADLKRGGLISKTDSPSRRRAQTARNTQVRPQATRKGKESHRRPLRNTGGPEPGLLTELLTRFPVPKPGSRHNQFVRLVCALVCDRRSFPDDTIRSIVLDWWRHWHDQGLCRTRPDPRAVDVEIRRTRRSHSRGRISTGITSRYAPLLALVRRPLPFLPYGGLGGGETPAAEPIRLGSTEAVFVATLLVHFAGESVLAHPLDESYRATNKQLIEKMKWVHGSVIEGKELRELKSKFVTTVSRTATKLELLFCVREGYRTKDEQVASLYRFSCAFVQLLEAYSVL
jgi:Bifunctional DNA primase/polymerase, N-terminal